MTSKLFDIVFASFSICFFNVLLSKVEIKPRCLDSIFNSGFFGIMPTIGILVFSRADLHKISCFLLPILLRIIPTIQEFLWKFLKPNAVAAIERAVLLASKIKITGEFVIVAT